MFLSYHFKDSPQTVRENHAKCYKDRTEFETSSMICFGHAVLFSFICFGAITFATWPVVFPR
jgi:hypothetical protein